MIGGFPIMPLSAVLEPVERPESPIPGCLYRQVGVRLWGEGAYERESLDGSQTKYKSLSRIEADDIVVNKIWARNGTVAVISEDLAGCYVSSEFPTFIPNNDKLEPRWFHWFTKTPLLWKQCDEKSRGTSGKNRIRPERFLEILLPLPSLTEQRRIVARIEELTAIIDEARSLREEARNEAAIAVSSTIAQLFETGPQRGWTEGFLGDYVFDDCYGTSEKTTDDKTATPILRMGNIQNGRLDLRDLKYLRVADKDRRKFILQKGDILVNRTNSAELVGKCAVFDVEGEYGFASYLIRLRLDAQRAEPRLVAAYINSPAGRRYMFRERKQMTGQANVNSKKLKALPLALPSLPEQRHILAYLDDLQDKVDAVKKLQEETSEELDALMPSILSRAFSGAL